MFQYITWKFRSLIKKIESSSLTNSVGFYRFFKFLPILSSILLFICLLILLPIKNFVASILASFLITSLYWLISSIAISPITALVDTVISIHDKMDAKKDSPEEE
jgi:hypothetical protein